MRARRKKNHNLHDKLHFHSTILSTRAKIGIGVGVALGALVIIPLIWVVFWYDLRSVAKNTKPTLDEDLVQKFELEAGISRAVEIGEPLSEEGNQGLERLSAVELEGRGISAGSGVSGRAELEARRATLITDPTFSITVMKDRLRNC